MKLAALGVGDFRLSASGEVARGCTSARGSLPAMAALTERITVVVKIDPGTEHASIFLFLESDLLVWQALRQPDPSPSLHPAARVSSWSAFHRCPAGTQSAHWAHPSHKRDRTKLYNPSASNLFLVFA
jgi:hypothetical protein